MLDKAIALIVAYRYWAIFPMSLVEAPLMSIVVGFFAVSGKLNLLLAFPLVVAGDFVGDTALYLFGRLGRRKALGMIVRGRRSARQAARVLRLSGRYDRQAIIISKLVHGIGFTGLIMAGSARVPYGRFIATCFMVTVVQSAILACAGVISGGVYQQASRYLGYLNVFAALGAILIVFIAYRSLSKIAGPRRGR